MLLNIFATYIFCCGYPGQISKHIDKNKEYLYILVYYRIPMQRSVFMVETQNDLKKTIYSVLRKRILSQYYSSQNKLSEVILAREFKCSRTPVREALKRLEQDNLIVIQPKSGSYVKEQSATDNKNMMEVRAYIEALAVRLLIEKKTDIKPIKQLYQAMDKIIKKKKIDMIIFGEKHYQFHKRIVDLTGNKLCIQMFNRLNLISSMTFFQEDETNILKTHSEHFHIIEMIEKADRSVEKFMIEHLWKKRNKYFQEAEKETTNNN